MLIETMSVEGADYIPVGSIIACTTCFGQRLQGEVMAFDRQTRMLSLKNPSAAGKPGTVDIHLINVNMVGGLVVIREATESPPPLQNLNYTKLTSRAQTALSEKQRAVNSVGIGVTPTGQRLFNTIAKTIDEIKWGGKEGKEILVMGQISISPPYSAAEVRGKDNQALNHVRKIVEKFYRDQQKREAAGEGGDVGASSPSSSESSKSNTPTPPSMASSTSSHSGHTHSGSGPTHPKSAS